MKSGHWRRDRPTTGPSLFLPTEKVPRMAEKAWEKAAATHVAAPPRKQKTPPLLLLLFFFAYLPPLCLGEAGVERWAERGEAVCGRCG